MNTIWTPKGEFLLSAHPDIQMLNRHVKMYDEDLSVAVNEQTGDVCVFKDTELYGTIPVCGWQRIPSIDECMKKLYEIDTFRHGDKVLKTVWKAAEEERKELERPANEAIQETAERIEFEMRQR